MAKTSTRKTSKRTTKTAKRSTAGGGVKLSLKLDDAKVKRIQQCLKKGQLTITVSRLASLARGENGYQYD